MAINHPISKELITNKTEIKKAYLEHNVGILTKKPIANSDNAGLGVQAKILLSPNSIVFSLKLLQGNSKLLRR